MKKCLISVLNISLKCPSLCLVNAIASKSSANEYCVYRIENVVNHRFYVGSTSDPHRRWRQHQTAIAENGLSVQLRTDCERYGYGLEHFSFKVLRKFRDRPSMLWFEQALIRLHWGTYANYNTAVEVIPGNIRKIWITWNAKNQEIRRYLSWQAAARDMGIKFSSARKAASLPTLVNDWLVCRVNDGTAVTDLQQGFLSLGLSGTDVPDVMGFDGDGSFWRRDPDWGEVTSSMNLPINDHQMYPEHLGWEYRLAATRARAQVKLTGRDSTKKKFQQLALHYSQWAKSLDKSNQRDWSE